MLNQKITSLSLRKLRKLKAISKDEKKDKAITYGAIPLVNKNTEILVHRGENKLFYYLEKFNQSQYKSKFHYSVIDSNDASLINAVHLHYQFSENEHTLMLYLGNDYHQVLVFLGNDYVKSIPIVIPKDFYEIKEIVRSKLMLLLDEGELPQPVRMILAGEHSKADVVEYFQEFYPNLQVEQFQCSNLQMPETSEIDSYTISEFIIPITLAWKAAGFQHDKMLPTNLLDKKVIERQKVFRLSWHGFVIIALIFGFSTISTRNILLLQEKVKSNVRTITGLQIILKENELYTKENESIYKEIEALKDSENKVRSILHNQNKLSFILHEISSVFSQNPITWLKEFSIKEDYIQIYGVTTKLENVVTFSGLFPDGKINFVKQEEIAQTPVYAFEIHYPYQTIKITELSLTKKASVKYEEKTLYNEIVHYYTQKKWDAALARINDFALHLPESALLSNIFYLKGEILYWLNDFQNAESALKLALKKGGNLLPFTYYMLAKTMRNLNQTNEANGYCKRLEQEFPNHYLTESAFVLKKEWEANHE
jgi:TolA-binding protein